MNDQKPVFAAPFGLSWYCPRSSVLNRFNGLTDGSDDDSEIVFDLTSFTDAVWRQGGFCPSALTTGADHYGDEALFEFSEARLHAVRIRFGYGFSAVGQDPDTLSEQSMSAIARTELHKMVFELAARYGAPENLSETTGKLGRLHTQGMALFVDGNGAPIQLILGHDGGSSVIGQLRYHAPNPDLRGF